MNFNNLDATIYTEGLANGESGQAKISPFDRTCEFTGEFVPMLMIGAPVIVVCKFHDVPLLRVFGKAYLSTRNFLRITDVECSLCDGAENLIETNVSISAEVIKPSRRSEKVIPCYISAIGVDMVTLSGCNLNPDGADKRITLRIEEPVFPYTLDLPLVSCDKGLRFGDSPRLAYRYEEISPKELGYIRAFVRERENQKLADLFKPKHI
ncbi:MAG: hypothetical protein E7509_01710 [Ruminococcus sp.]|nr:hypothetical protein [Ruminococcus sp.]